MTAAALAACLCYFETSTQQSWRQRQREELECLLLSHGSSENWKAGGADWFPESVSTAARALTGGLQQGCGLASLSGDLFSWDCEEEEEEWVLSLELLRVSVLVLVFFIFLLLASGALSTVCRRKPSRLHLLNAWNTNKKMSFSPKEILLILLIRTQTGDISPAFHNRTWHSQVRCKITQILSEEKEKDHFKWFFWQLLQWLLNTFFFKKKNQPIILLTKLTNKNVN